MMQAIRHNLKVSDISNHDVQASVPLTGSNVEFDDAFNQFRRRADANRAISNMIVYKFLTEIGVEFE